MKAASHTLQTCHSPASVSLVVWRLAALRRTAAFGKTARVSGGETQVGQAVREKGGGGVEGRRSPTVQRVGKATAAPVELDGWERLLLEEE